MQGAAVASYELGVDPVGENTCEIPLEVITHFRFDLHMGLNVKSCARSQTNIIDVWAGAAQVEIVGEYADLNMIALRHQYRCTEAQRQDYRQDSQSHDDCLSPRDLL